MLDKSDNWGKMEVGEVSRQELPVLPCHNVGKDRSKSDVFELRRRITNAIYWHNAALNFNNCCLKDFAQ